MVGVNLAVLGLAEGIGAHVRGDQVLVFLSLLFTRRSNA